jgi:ribose-phosphate pyrophosphokinase
LLLGFPEYEEPARRLAEQAGCRYATVAVHQFPDGESLVRLPPELPRDVVLCRSLNDPNHKLVELELAAATALELGAKRLTLVAPYLCYMRQDTAFHAGEAVSQRIIGRALARNFDRVITVDPHLHRTARLEDAVPVSQAVSVSAAPVMSDWLRSLPFEPVLIAPDEEAEQWVKAIAEPAGLESAVATKTRLGDRRVEISLPSLALEGRHAVIVDDMASTGRTLAETARALLAAGATSVAALVTHALFVEDALDELARAGISEIHSTDSIPHMTNCLHLARALADALAQAR